MALSKADKGLCLEDAVKITVAYASATMEQKEDIATILDSCYKKLCILRGDAEKG